MADEDLKILAAQGLADTFANNVNEYLRDADENVHRAFESSGISSRIDFSEASLEVLDIVFSLIVANSQGPLALLFIRKFEPYVKHDEALDRILRSGFFYVAEVAHRNLGAKWMVKKSFWSGTKLGLQLPNGDFVAEEELQKGLPKAIYLALKARIKGVPVNTVELSKRPPDAAASSTRSW
ncbi:MAG TPA: hypothetical protein VJA94_22440 [Candidatus Angelobacter sp.]